MRQGLFDFRAGASLKLGVWFLCHSGSLWSATSTKAPSVCRQFQDSVPMAETGPGEMVTEGRVTLWVGGQPRDTAAFRLLDLWNPQVWVKGSPATGEGRTATDPGSLACKTQRLPEACGPASCAAGSSCTLSPQAARPPTAGSIFPGPAHVVRGQRCSGRGRAGRQEQPGRGRGWGHTSREWREKSLQAERPLCTLDVHRPASHIPPQLCTRSANYPAIHRSSRPADTCTVLRVCAWGTALCLAWSC